MSYDDLQGPPEPYDEDRCGGCGECAQCFREINRKYDAMHCATEAAWWRDKGAVLLGLDSDDEGCIHVSYTEQAGGFIICDYCGEDITREIFRSAAHEP